MCNEEETQQSGNSRDISYTQEEMERTRWPDTGWREDGLTQEEDIILGHG